MNTTAEEERDTTGEEGLSKSGIESLNKLKTLHASHLKFEQEYRREWNDLKLKYYKLLEPLYEERKNVLMLEQPALPSASSTTASSTETANKLVDSTEFVGTTGLSIPDFWLTAFKNNSTVGQTIEPHDVPILNSLRNVGFKWVDELTQTSFLIEFHFGENQFFKNSVLTKLYVLEADTELTESVLTRTEGTVIDWCDDKNVTKKTNTRKQRNKKTGQLRVVVQEVPRESFFNLFETRVIPEDSKLEQMAASEVTELENSLELEYEIGCILRDKVIPHALGWYLGTEVDDDDDEDDDSISDSYGDDHDDDDDSDEDKE